MLITKDLAQYIAEQVNSPERREARSEDLERYLMYNGKTNSIIKKAISKEFKKAETINELISRIVPINIIQKIINKLATIYTEAPVRRVKDGNERDSEYLEQYVEGLNFNQRQKEANRYFKLFKRNLKELYVDEDGTPSCRNLPRHSYEVFSFSPMSPNKPDVICKIIKDDKDYKQQVLGLWSNESFLIVNGKGEINTDKMTSLNNLDGVNPYGVMPFIYINESSDTVDPLTDDDLLKIAITIPVILTDLLFACKYQCWSIIYTIGDVGDLPSNPNSVIPLNFGENGEKPEIGQIKPEVDIDKIVGLVTTILSMLLSTKNLKATAISPKGVDQAISGISKMLDEAESIEDKKDQQAFFERDEEHTWDLLANKLIPVWKKQNILSEEYNVEFSSAFDVEVIFRSPDVLLSDKEKVENSSMRLKNGFSTLRRELSILYPNMTREEILELEMEIKKEKNGSMLAQLEPEMDQNGVESDLQDQSSEDV